MQGMQGRRDWAIIVRASVYFGMWAVITSA